MRVSALVWVGCLTWCAAACSATASDSDISETSGEGAGEAPKEIVDPDGKRWLRGQKVEYSNDALRAPDNSESVDRDDREYTLEQFAERVRPEMEFGGYEYTLDARSAREYAQELFTALHSADPAAIASGSESDGEGVTGADGNLFDLDTGRAPRQVFGTDSRSRIDRPWDRKPWNWIASMGTSQCTTFKMINHHTAISAAHCHHTGSAWKTRRTIQFGASASDPSPLQPLDSGCYARTVPGCWDGDDRACDYAIVRLRGGGPWCNFADYNTGHFGFETVGSGWSVNLASVAGYPAKSDDPPPGTWTEPEMFWHEDGSGYTNCCGINPNMVWYTNDTSGGQSGAPYWTFSDDVRRVRGIHWGVDDPAIGSTTNGARRITSGLIDWFNANAGF